MPGPCLREFIGGNMYSQALTEFYAWPTPYRNYRQEHLPPGPEEILCLAHAVDKIVDGNIYLQAMKKFYAWPTRERIYRREHLAQTMTKFYAWLTPQRNHRREHLHPGHEEILCLAHAVEKL